MYSFGLRSLFVQPVGQRWCVAHAKKVDGHPRLAQQKKLLKFQESCWKCFAYTALAMSSAYALSKETFWWNTAEFWTDCYQMLPCPYQASPEMNFAYSMEAAYYMYVPASLYSPTGACTPCCRTFPVM